MTDEEYDKAKTALIGTAKVGADKPVLGERQAPAPQQQRPRTNRPGFDVLPPEQ
jgi:hypothetical protein